MERSKLNRILAPIALAGALYATGCANARLLGIPLVLDPVKREQILKREDDIFVKEQERLMRETSSLRPMFYGNKTYYFKYSPNK
ncbi:MAG: hypothetical protein AABW82_04675 [Nanoarchaeota archaeon]